MASSQDPRSAQSIAPMGLALEWTFVSLAIIVVGLRLYTRTIVIKALGPEDVAVFLGIVFSITYGGLMIRQAHFGLGRHFDTLTDGQKTSLLKSLYFSITFYQLTLSSAKISICTQYMRLTATKTQRLVLTIMLGIITAYSTWTALSAIFMCTPPAHFWDPTVKGHCLEEQKLGFTNAALNIVTDIAMLVLPIPTLIKLNLPKRQKIILACIMSLGALVTLTSCIRLRSLYIISISDDVSWTNVAAGFWSGIETNVALICASLPALRPLVSRYLPRLLEASSNMTNRKSRYTGVSSQVGTSTESRSPATRSDSDLEENKTEYFQGIEDEKMKVVTAVERELDPASNRNDGTSDGSPASS